MKINSALGATAALVACLAGCVIAPAPPPRVVVVPPPPRVVVAPGPAVVVPVGVVYVEPTYVTPGPGYVWVHHPRYGWGWRHHHHGWHRGW